MTPRRGLVIVALGALMMTTIAVLTFRTRSIPGNLPAVVIQVDIPADTSVSEARGDTSVSQARPMSLVSPAVTRFCDQSLPLGDRLPADFSARVPRVDDAKSVGLVLALLSDRSQSEALRHEAGCLLERSERAEVLPVLMALVVDARETDRFRAFIAQHLGLVIQTPFVPPDNIIATLRALVVDATAPSGVRSEALLGLLLAHDAAMMQEVGQADLAAPQWSELSDLVIRCIRSWYETGRRVRIASVRAALSERNGAGAAAAAYVLGEWRDIESRTTLNVAAQSNDRMLQQAAVAALHKLDHP